MGRPEQFVKQTFAQETELATRGALHWEDPPEIGLLKLVSVQGDGLLLVRMPAPLAELHAPWSEARGHVEILLELKMAGDHVDVPAVQRAVLRRQALCVQRVESSEEPRSSEGPLWIAAPHVPGWLRGARTVRPVGRGCYAVEPSWSPFLWIAANELPLQEELVPFLLARSGRALDEFARWVASRRPLEWMLSMLQYTSMSTTVREDLLRRFARSDDPEVEARRQEILQALLEASPHVKDGLIEKGLEKGLEKGRLGTLRDLLVLVLARRQLAVTEAQGAQIEQCSDAAVLQRWFEQAMTAATAGEALR